MKTLNYFLVGLLFTAFLNSCDEKETPATDFIDQEKNAQIFLESVAIIPLGRTKISENQYAKIIRLEIYNDLYIPLTSYAINGEDFTDDGEFNDMIAEDGIYTSTITDSNSQLYLEENVVFVSNNFQNLNLKKFEITCKFRHIREGNSALGLSCENWVGCIELYDCEVTFGWD